MAVRVAINGFGRIGRLVLRRFLQEKDVEVVAVNDLVPAENLAYLFKYDSVHRTYPGEVTHSDQMLVIDGKKICVLCEKDPAKMPWKSLEIDYVIESTGLFTTYEASEKHIEAGCKRVIITAPSKSERIPTLVMGVNHETYNPQKDTIVSNASCTTNCLAPIVKVLLDSFGIEEGLMTTIHAATATQPTVDAPSKKDWRGGRAAFTNIIPSSTGAAIAVGLCLPEIKGKLTGMALRIPIIDVSVVDLTVKLKKETNYNEICHAMNASANGAMKGILAYCDEEVVSSDFIGSTYSSIFDKGAGIGLSSTFYKIIAWYDNEMGYACRVADLLLYMASK